jgi:NADPH:quinone reductase-like Zn-dependent oxidoreductase
MSPVDIPTHTRAVLLNATSNTLSLSPSHPLSLDPTALLIRVHSTGITRGELTWSTSGFVTWPQDHVPCYDVSGTVVLLPDTPCNFKMGDKVYGRVAAEREGAAREYATILPSEAAMVPEGLGMIEAASVPMSAHTAWQAVFEKGGLTGERGVPHVNEHGDAVLGQAKGKRVLILGAAGGVGLMAVQFALLAGAHVVGTASAKNEGYLRELGISEVVDYTKTSIQEFIAAGNDKFDLVFDCAGGKSMLDGWNGVVENGAYISVVPGFREPESGKPAGVRSTWFVMKARGEELHCIGKFFEKGLLKATVDSVWELEDFEAAFSKTASGHARGKVVLKIADA